MALTTIPRASSITATDANIGSASTINISRASSGFTHTITYSFGSLSGTIVTKTSDTSVGWTVPTTFFEQIPNASSGTVTLTCQTYNGNTLIGSKTTTMTVTVPTSGTNDSRPVIDAVTLNIWGSPQTLNVTDIVSYLSNVTVNITGRCVNYAGFSKIQIDDLILTGATTSVSEGTTSITFNTVFTPLNNPLIDNRFEDGLDIKLIDTRGFISETKTISQDNGDYTYAPYILPTINVNVERLSPTSNSVNLSFSGNFYNGYFRTSGSPRFNDLDVDWRYKEYGGDWITIGADDNNGWHYLTLNTDYEYIQDENKYQKIILQGIPIYDAGVDSSGENYFYINGYLYGLCAITGQEIPTNEYIDGEQVFRKRIDTGSLPNTTSKTVASGLTPSEINLIRMQGVARAGNNTQIPLPFLSVTANASVEMSLQANGNIQIIALSDRSDYIQSYVDLYYTKITS